jgi:putative tryptophan/tyrosine transport system substrate-binding protein
MKRRAFITLLGGAVAWPQDLLAQVTSRRRLVAWWVWPPTTADYSRTVGQFLSGMRELGYAEGRDFDTAFRPFGLEAELVQLNPDVIVAAATIHAVAARKATTTIPIVVPVLADPVELGLVASEARPGGNLTGIVPYVKGLPAKQLELAREIVPNATRIGLLDDAIDPKARPQRQEIEAAGQALRVNIVTAEVRTPDDIGPAYETFARERVGVVVVEQSTMLLLERKRIAELAAARRLPSVYGYREHVDAGGLISYGVILSWCFHRAAYYVDRILKGVKPADLPVEFPTKVELVINLATAKSLGLIIPPTLLARADDVIE